MRAGHRASLRLTFESQTRKIRRYYLTDKTRTVLNNGKARLRRRMNWSKHNLRQADHSLASIPKMRNGCDALLVPNARKNWQQ